MKVRKKPIVVEAVQFTDPDGPLPEGVYQEQQKWGGGDSYQGFFNEKYGPIYKFFIDTLEGQRFEVSVGDWIITGVNGERYAIKPGIFKRTYERVNRGRRRR